MGQMNTIRKIAYLKWEIIFLFSILLAFWLRDTHLQQRNENDVLFHYPVVDASEYHKEAESYAGKRHEWRVPIHGPLYPWLLGQIYRLTHSDPLRSRRLQMVMGFASVMLIFFGGRLIIGRRAAMLSGLLLAFYRPAFLFDAELYAEVITVFLTSAAALLIILMGRKGTWKMAIPLGLTLGLCALSRTNLIVLLPLSTALVIWQIKGPRVKKWGLGCLVLIIGLLPIAPVTFLNYRTTGDFILIQGRTGHNLYQANHPGSDGTVDIRPGPAFQSFLRRPIVEANALGPKAESDYYLKKFRQFVFRHPVEFLLLLSKKAWNSLSPVEIPASYDPEGQQRFSWVARQPQPGFASILPFLIVGLFRYPGDRSSFVSLSLVLLCVWSSLLLGFAAG
ncbi:MAG: glycosyltransferase family 39 protein, partial [Deltaproteobacteria bacterium]|nr:glycosyltransferase family 39 protein [Deltaproteobacteria bacterium]